MSNDKHYPTHPGAEHPPTMTCEIPLEEYESIKRENERLTIDKRNAELRADVADATVEKLQAKNAELKDEINELRVDLEGAKATAYADSVDAGMENRKLKRALWMARVELCHRLDVDKYLRKHRNSWYNENCLTWAEACVAMEVKMCKAESKCRAKAEEYK